MGKIRTTPLALREQFPTVDDEQLKLTLVGLADRYNERAREIIYRTYQDDRLATTYRAIRVSGEFQKGSKDKVRRKIIEWPNVYVYDFAETVLTAIYGPDWRKRPGAFKHQLVAPWVVVSNL